MTSVHLVDRSPSISPDELIAQLVPPPHFQDVSFESYKPDPTQPSQGKARDALREFTDKSTKKSFFKKMLGKSESSARGLYLDGGYGVGKTHLLASAWHRSEKPAAFGTFVEYTNLIGALGFKQAAADLSQSKLVCVDEFELDDPGDTVMMSRLMRELTDAGVKIVATSNTLPGALGQGRFAAQDFLREIQALADQFEVLSIDGDDYRHRGIPNPPEPVSNDELQAVAERFEGTIACDEFDQLMEHLPRVHPSRYRLLLDDIDAVAWQDVHTIENENVALRFVALVDRMYDRGVAIHNSGVRLDKIFTEDMLGGGYRKKYMRCLSRLTALATGEER
ncbi:cell division protein ZapE [Brevibacterium paucivorans]|uniref:Cell division protein ZapE n=1 Tax=Brevibacterium paucivorans TaxID=170994 RepID=A0ABS2SM69_9MICO|nr:cell division protein ZapE [Brevibacterium paucivorans]